MANKIDQKSYLQKYLNGPSGDKKKKKKKHVKGKGLRIVDDDIDLTKIRPLDGDELDLFDEGEDAPQIVGIVDERPEDVKKLEQFKTTSKWKVINQDDGFNSKLQIEEIKKDIKVTEKENELVFGKMYSDSEDEKKNDSDLSPPRKQTDNHERNDISLLQTTDKSKLERTKHNDDSDQSPPRKSKDKKMAKRKKNKEYGSDASPPRERSERKNKRLESQSASARSSDQKSKTYTGRDRDGDLSPLRRRDREQKSKNYNSDLSPPRRHEDRKTERPRKPTRWGDADDSTHSRDLTRSDSPSDSINQRKSSRDIDRRSPSSDLSPPRKSQKVRHNKSPDSDLSPPRKRSSKPLQEHGRYSNDVAPTKKRRQSQSPGCKSKPNSSKRKNDSDSDMSPPRKGRNTQEKAYRRNSDSPPPTSKKMARTLDGKMAGLQDAKQLRRENEEFRRREEDVYTKMTDDVSGRNAKAVSRKSKRETSEEKQKHKEKAIRQKELDEKYKKWSRGVKQTEDQQSRVEDYLHEAAKPLARLRGDVDLEARLRQEERKGDPMLNYIRDKKRERGELGPEKPTYKGQYPPNRFDIRPGYRWDGVDRSNGYENKYFEQQSKRKAQEEEAYKWSTEDL